MTLTSTPTQTLSVLKHTRREQVDNDVNIPPAKTLTIAKHTWREQVDNNVDIPHPPTKETQNMEKRLFRYRCLGVSLGTKMVVVLL